MRSPARSAERREPAAARSPATPLARQEPEEPWSPEAAAYEARLAELQRERQRAEREKARAEAEAYSTAATRLQAAERGRGAKRRAREAADARAEEAAARDAAAARLQAAERGRTAKLETRRRRRRVEELGRGAARVAAKAEAAVARAAEAQAEEAAASPARALLRESRASRGSRGSPARKDDARGGDTARTPARKDRSPSASSGRAARRRREATPGEVSSAESREGSDPRVATLRGTSASWHRAFWASRLSDRSACCFEIKRIWLLCRHGRFSKLKPGTSRTAIFREAKNADTTMSSTTRHVGSDLTAVS